MKNLFTSLLISSLLFVACEGVQGPPGMDGQDGTNILGQSFEAEVSFLAENNFKALVLFPSDIDVYDGDIVVAYVLDGVVDELDIWEPLPRTLFFGSEILLYSFNYTLGDIEFFLDGTVDLNSLSDSFTQNVIFRVAILPAVLAKDIDLNNFENVMSAVQHQEILQ